MPKKRKKTSKNKRRTPKNTREVKPTHELPGGFWRQIVAILMLAIALFSIVTWFGHGGTVLNAIHQAFLNFIGIAVYGIPFLLVFLAVQIFRSEGNRVAFPVYLASLLILLWLSGIGGIWDNGGLVGNGLNSLMLNVLDQGVVILIYIVLLLITFLFLFAVNPLTLFTGAKNLAHPNKKLAQADSDGADQKGRRKLGDASIKVNFGANAVEPSMADGKRHRLVKAKTAKADQPTATAPKEPTALISTVDPDWKMPSVNLLAKSQMRADAGNIQQNADIIKDTLGDFGIDVEMETVNVGPRVTQYTMRPPSGVNLSKILARDKELALNLAVDKIRIEAPIPGTRSVGIELPNVKPASVTLRSILESETWKKAKSPLTFAVGQDISGNAYVADLADMPHLLIAGTTGSGKSVMTNTLISSLLYRNGPSDLKFIIVDPKQVEMTQYNNIPHLLTPIITNTEKALSAMKWAVGEMERRYTLMSEVGVKKISDYNAKVVAMSNQNQPIAKDAADAPNDAAKDAPTSDASQSTPTTDSKMPYIVILIDEMADLMMMAGKDLEALVVRIAQKGRAAGIHLVLATQRPEVKVITGLIKANVPGRIAFAVGSQMDSRIMIDQGGAEKLLGKGDMLLLTTQMMGKPRRIQGAFASDDDINKVANFLRKQRLAEYNDEVIAQTVSLGSGPTGGGLVGDLGRRFDPNDPIVRKAVEISISKGKFSTALLQTYLGKGHGFVSGLAIWLEEIGVIGPQNGNKPRDILVSSLDEFDSLAGT